jgi:hypothetical protein
MSAAWTDDKEPLPFEWYLTGAAVKPSEKTATRLLYRIRRGAVINVSQMIREIGMLSTFANSEDDDE